jgi:hypothetical protein
VTVQGIFHPSKAVFPLAKFTANTPLWATLGDATQIVMILSASHQPRWPSEVQGLSLMFSPKTSLIWTNIKFTGQFLKPQRCLSQIQKEVQFTTKNK